MIQEWLVMMRNPFVAHCQSSRPMKNASLSSFSHKNALRGFLLSCGLCLLASASAQNLLQNGDFEAPLDPWDPTGLTGGKTNWTLVYNPTSGGPGTFAMKDRSTEASRHGATEHGAHLRPATECWCQAYFAQTVSNLIANADYVVNGWINIGYINNKFHVYIETLGGPAGTTIVRSPDVDVTKWNQHWVTNTASSSGTLVVRLRLDKQDQGLSLPGVAKYKLCDARFDDLTLTPAPPVPAQILSFTVTNQTAAFKWTSAVANRYDIEVSSTLGSWSKFQTNLVATGTNLTYTTNLVANPSLPQFFRILNRGMP